MAFGPSPSPPVSVRPPGSSRRAGGSSSRQSGGRGPITYFPGGLGASAKFYPVESDRLPRNTLWPTLSTPTACWPRRSSACGPRTKPYRWSAPWRKVRATTSPSHLRSAGCHRRTAARQPALAPDTRAALKYRCAGWRARKIGAEKPASRRLAPICGHAGCSCGFLSVCQERRRVPVIPQFPRFSAAFREPKSRRNLPA
jgi:hypothetical protein